MLRLLTGILGPGHNLNHVEHITGKLRTKVFLEKKSLTEQFKIIYFHMLLNYKKYIKRTNTAKLLFNHNILPLNRFQNHHHHNRVH